MLHENNAKALQDFTAQELAKAYRDYLNNAHTLADWVSIYFPDGVSTNDAMQFWKVCQSLHELGI